MRDLYKVLTVLQEEAAELIVAISKIKRFGFDSYNPELLGEQPTNLDNLIQEIGDVESTISVLIRETKLPITRLEFEQRLIEAQAKKLKNLKFTCHMSSKNK